MCLAGSDSLKRDVLMRKGHVSPRIKIPPEIHSFFSDVGKTLLVKGDPGAGKTTFALSLLKEIGEEKNGVFISTRTEVEDIYEHFPWLSGVLLEHNMVDVTKMKFTDISTFLNSVYAKIIDIDLDYPMVVIDSLDVIALNSHDDGGKLKEGIISFSKKTAANVVLVAEYAGKRKLDYLVDGTITLKDIEIHGEAQFGDVWYGGLESRDSREILIEKLRGTQIRQKRYTISLHDGVFQYFEPFLPRPIRLLSEGKGDPDESTISSGSDQFDKLLGGGLAKGSFNLLEMEHGIDQRYIHLLSTITSNAALCGRGIVLFPFGGKEMRNLNEALLNSESSDNISIVEECGVGTSEKTIPFNEDLKATVGAVFDIRSKEPERTYIYVVGLDLFEYYLGYSDAIKQLRMFVDRILCNGDILIGIAKRPQQMIDIISHMADRHFVFKDLDGSLSIYGMRPKTVIYNISSSEDGLIFTPIV